MKMLFWVSVLLIAYVYVGYPLLLAGWSAVRHRGVGKRRPAAHEPWPSVSVIIAARNEASRLPARLRNLIDQQYPGSIEILVVSDGSTDDTASAVAPFFPAVRLIEIDSRGKAAALNAGIARATGDIVVFADARQRFAKDAISELVANFADPHVGGVTGELVLDCEQPNGSRPSTVAEGVGLYWSYEKWLRRRESAIASTLGATGAIYAIRRELWRPLPPQTLLDDVLTPMRVVLQGKRVVFEDRARAFDRVSADGAAESRRKTRTLAGNYQILRLEPRLLIPFVNPVWIQYASHKVGRLLVPWALVAVFMASAALVGESWLFTVALLLQLGFYGLAVLGGWIDTRQRVASPRVGHRAEAR